MELPVLIAVAVIGFLAFVGTFGAVYALAGRLSTLEERFRQLKDTEGTKIRWRDYLTKTQSLIERIGRAIPRSPEEMSRQERRLVQAGIRRRDGAILLLGSQVALGIALIILLAVTGLLWEHVVVYSLVCILVGFAALDIGLALKVKNRKHRIQRALPDALDLEVVCVEAGLGLDQSLMRVGRELVRNYPDLSEELQLVNLELNAGKSRQDALRNLARRTDVEDLRALVAVLVQTDRFGTSIADSLRVYSDAFRTKRKQRAEEQAAKMGVKMIPPLFFFILPATFAVVVGPAVIRIANDLLPLLRVPVQ